MERIFDFDRLRDLFRGGFRLRFDAMHAVTGPYAREIFERRLGAPAGHRGQCRAAARFRRPSSRPEPDLRRRPGRRARPRPTAPDFGAASDGDGDRNMVVGPRPGRSARATAWRCSPPMRGWCRGSRTGCRASRARCRPAARSTGSPPRSASTATRRRPGGSIFGTLLDAGRIALCGEESAGTGSNHVREKDGVWAVLFWLNVLAVRGEPATAIVADHWRRYGRAFLRCGTITRRSRSSRAEPADRAAARQPRRPCPAGASATSTIAPADDFAYTDPVDGSVSAHQGMRVEFDDGARIVYRLSGTGTEGATLRVYLERFEPDPRPARASRRRRRWRRWPRPRRRSPTSQGILGRSRPSVVA